MKARFKEITEGELAFHIVDLYNKNQLRFVPCGDVRKVTFFIYKMHSYGYCIHDERYPYYKDDYERKYSEEEPSFNEIKELAKNYEQQQKLK